MRYAGIAACVTALLLGAGTLAPTAALAEARGEIRFEGKASGSSSKPFRSADRPSNSGGGWGASGNDSHKKGSKPYTRSGPRREDVWRPSFRDARGDRMRDERRREWRDERRHDWRDDHRGDWRRDRHRTDHRRRHGPRVGVVINTLPGGYRRIHHHNHSYFFASGLWYQPWGSAYIRIAAPIGIVIGALPFGYSTLYVGDRLYYRYDDGWYLPHERGYVVVQPPAGYGDEDVAQQQTDEELFAYPNRGQNETRQAQDRFECHSWAADKTGYDPSLVSAAGASTDSLARRPDYLRAMTACLEGRGYTVR